MAIQRVGIQFDFNANTKQAQANLNVLEKTMARLENRMRTMGGPRTPDNTLGGPAGRQAQDRLRAYGETQIDLKTPIKQTELLTDNIRKGKIGWDEYGRAVKNNSAIVTQNLAQQTGAIHSVTRAGNGFMATFTPNAMLRGVSGIEFATARMHAFGEATRAVSQHTIDMGKNLAFSARQMSISLSMPLAIVGGLAIKQFTDIDKQLTDISKVYDVHAEGVEESTGRIRASMKDLARELSRTQGAEIQDTLDIAQFYAQQGRTGDDLRNATLQASRLMVLGDVDKDDAQKTITTLTAVVGANAEELSKYVDYLNKVEDSTQLTMQDFAKTLPTIAPLVKTFIPDDKDALMSTSASMMEVARRAGFDPKESSNAWKSMYGSFVRPSMRTANEFEELTGKYGNRMRMRDLVERHQGNPVDILTELSKITEGWSTTDKGELMTRLTGKWQLSRGLGFMNAMDRDVGNNATALDRMAGINEELVNNPEDLADNSKRQMDLIKHSAHTQLQQLKQDITLMFADLGERIFLPVMDALGNVMEAAKAAYNTIAELPGPIKDILSIGAQLTFIAGPILAAFAATKMLAGFAGRLAASFATTAAAAGRIGASMLGVNMMGSGKLEGKDQSIARIQEKDDTMLNLSMQEVLDAENATRTRSVALVEEKNAKIRESINLEREKNRAMTGTITPEGSPTKDPERDLRKYQASLKNARDDWPMAIQAGDIGPESFRRHAGKIGAPATRMQGVGLDQNKVFGSSAPFGTASLVPRTPAVSAGLSDEARKYIQTELDKVNSGIAIRRSHGERSRSEIDADIKNLQASRPRNERGHFVKSPERAVIDGQISALKQTYSKDSTILGEKSFGLDSLERQRADLLKAANGNSIQQAKIMSQVAAQQKFEVDVRRKNNQAIMEEAERTRLRNRVVRGKEALGSTVRSTQGAIGNLKSNVAGAYVGDSEALRGQFSVSNLKTNLSSAIEGDASGLKNQLSPSQLGQNMRSATAIDTTELENQFKRGAENVKSFSGSVKDAAGNLVSRFGRSNDAMAARDRAWNHNTVRGGSGEYFRGHMTPRDIRTAQKSDQFREIRMALDSPGSDEAYPVGDLIKENEAARQELYNDLEDAYNEVYREVHGTSDSIGAAQFAQSELEKSDLPTTAALQRETDIYSARMQKRADDLEKRQISIAENSGKWAANVTNTSMAFGLIGSMATSTLGIQNSLVDGALMFANSVGAVGMVMPGIVEKSVASFANMGSLIIDKFDAKTTGTWIGGLLGDTMGTSLTGRLSEAFSKMTSLFMTFMPYLAGAGLAMMAIKGAWDWHRKDSREYVENLKEANKSVELHAELLGYVRKENQDAEDMTYVEATEIRVNALREDDTGRSQFVQDLADVQGPSNVKIPQMNAILSQEAVRILNDGGDEADVRSMVDAALQAAGVTDEKVIEGVKLNFKDFEVTANTVAGDMIMDQIFSDVSGENTARTFGDRVDGIIDHVFSRDFFSGKTLETLNLVNWIERTFINGEEQIEVAAEHLTGTAEAAVERISTQLSASLASASTDEDRSKIAANYIETIKGAVEAAEESGDAQAIGAARGIMAGIFDDMTKYAPEGTAAAVAISDNFERIRDSYVSLQAIMGGTGQEQFSTPTLAADAYTEALAEQTEKYGELTVEEKLALHNLIAYAGGLQQIETDARQATDQLGKFKAVVRDPDDPLAMPQTAQETIDHFVSFDPVDVERREAQLKGLSSALESVPGEFHRRFSIGVEIDGSDQDRINELVNDMKSATVAGQQFAADEASRQFKERQDATMDQIKAQTDASMKALDAQQKAAQEAFEARGKALDAQFKEETKALDKQHKEEQKVFDKRRRDEDRAYNKQEKEQKKAFSKQQKEEREAFDKSWDDRGDAVSGYYDNAIKAIEEQGRAEDRLDQLRERNAERERKRREYLANMANTNIDINVAIAGGNLDEAARLANTSAMESSNYYQDRVDMEANYAAQDRGDSRQKRIDALGQSRDYSMDEFGRIRDDATEDFSETQELAQERLDEELQLERDIYDEKKALEAEQFAEKRQLEQERLQEDQQRRREALDAEKEALQERHNAERDMIQETAKQKEDGARRHFEATQRSLDLEMQALMADIPIGLEARKQWIKDVEGAYARHGVYLNEDFAPKVNRGMTDVMITSMDSARNKMAADAAWENLGLSIGHSLREGTLKGYSGEQAATAVLFGTDIGKPEYGNSTFAPDGKFDPGWRHRHTVQQEPLGRSKGGPIYGPGTGTSDSIPALLSNGEHVLTAKEVKAAGGHKAVERLRKAIESGRVKRFATGGGVGTSRTDDSELNINVRSTGTGTVADGGVMSALRTDVSNMGTVFDDTLTNTVEPAWQQFGDMMVKVKKDSVDPVLEGSKIALADYAAQTNQIMSANMNPAWVQFGQNLKSVKETVFDVVMTDMKAGIQSLSSSISTAIANEIMPKWTEGSEHVRTMQDTIIAPAMEETRAATTQTAENFGTAADMIGVGWGRVKENSAEPVRYTIGTVFNDGLVGMWNNVAEALDLDKMTPHEFSFASGGVMPGYTPGRDVHHFTSPTGGKLHLSGGEAIMRPEWTRAVGGEAAVHRMNAQAKSGNYSFHEGGVTPENFEPDRRHLRQYQTHEDHFDEGGVFKVNQAGGNRLAQTPLSTPFNQRLWDIVRTIAPGMSLTSTEVWRPSGAQRGPHHGTGHAIDVSDGGAQMPTPTTSGVAKFFYENYGPALTELIHWPLNGWQNIKNGAPLNYDAGTNAGHANHIHLAAHTVLPDPGGAVPMFAGLGAGSLGGMDPAILAAVNKFNEQKDQLKKDIERHIKGGPDTIMKAIPGKIFTGLTDGMQKKIMEAMPMAAMANLGAYGLNHMDHVKEIIAAAKERGLPKTAAKIAIATALVESELRMYANHAVPESLSFPHEAIGSDHDSVGLFQQRDNGAWGTVAQRMNARASAGLFYNALVKIPGWQTMDPGAAAQKVQVSAFPEKYAPRMGEALALIDRAGGWDSVGTEGAGGGPESDKKETKKSGDDPSDWFDRGGVASGTGVMTKGVISPERVLSPRQTQAFERLVPAMDRVAAGGISEDQWMAKTNFDRDTAYRKMVERNSTAQIDFTEILEKMTPILTQITGQLKGMIVPGITGYANDLIKLDTDAQRIDKVADDIVEALTGIQVPEINTDMQFNVGGNIYGDAQLNAILEQWKQQTIREVQMQQALAQQAIGGK